MALSLPTTSNTVGGLSNVALVADANTFTSSFAADSNFATNAANVYFTKIGTSAAMSANGDYLLLSTAARPVGKTYTQNIGGVVVLYTRSGNTWTQNTSFVSGDLVSGTNYNKYGSPNGSIGARDISIDDAGENVLIAGGENDSQGRIEFWNRSGSTWSRISSFDGSSNERLGWSGNMLAGNGNSAIVLANTAIKRYVKSGGSWSADSTHGTYSPTDSSGTSSHELYGVGNLGLGYNTDGTKYAWVSTGPTGSIRINTRYYDGASWQTSTPASIDFSSVTSPDPTYTSYSSKFTMSHDGNYCFAGMADTNNTSLLVGFVWNSGTNTWTQQQFFDLSGQRSDAYVAQAGPIFTNSDGSKLVAGAKLDTGASDKDYMWRCWERSGSTWTFKNKYHNLNGNQIPAGQTVAQADNGPDGADTGSSATGGAMSKDGLHMVFTHPAAVDGGIKRIAYFQPTGITQSSVSNGQVAIHQGRRYMYNSAKSRWTPANRPNLDGISSSRKRSRGIQNAQLESDLDLVIDGVSVSIDAFAGRTETYANASIFPFSSLQSGDQAIALDTGYLYVTDGSGWFKVANSQPV